MHPGTDVSYTNEHDQPLNGQPYAECVGALLYISNCTRPDLALAVSMLARHMANPCLRHWEACMHVMRYLQGTKSKGLVLGASTDPLMGWTDADFAGCKDTRKSRGGFVYCLHGSAVSWCSKLQTCVALSTAESEYMASSAATREGVWLQRMCMDLGMPSGPFVLHMDNQAAKFMATNGAVSARTKHIAVPFHFVKDSVLRGVVQLQFVGSRDNLADVFTKPLAGIDVDRLVRQFGLK